MTISGRALTTLVMLAIFAGAGVLSLNFAEKARLVPLLVAIPGALLCLAQLAIDLVQSRRDAPAPPRADGGGIPHLRSEAIAFAWLTAFFAAIIGLGFLIGGPAVVFLYLRFGMREAWTTAVASAVAAWAVLYLVFERLLEIILFRGLIFESWAGM